MAKRKSANRMLLRAVLESRTKGAIQQISDACAEGADPDGIVPECSTSAGLVRGGSTMLTHAVHECLPRVVDKLLECGADPNLIDQNCWTPWMASTLVDGSKQELIQESLLRHGSSRSGDHVGNLVRAIAAGNAENAANLFQSEDDIAVLSTFRVDLIRHSIGNRNGQILELLLNKNMQPDQSSLSSAVRAKYIEGVEILLRHGLPPETPDQSETLLMTAASAGDLEIVKLLVKAGADVNRYANDNIEWVASYYAHRAGNTEIASWLTSQMDPGMQTELQNMAAARNPKFRVLYEQATAGEDMSTEEIVAVLEEWNSKYDINVDDVSYNHVNIKFSSLPDDFSRLYKEVEHLCPGATRSGKALEKDLKNNRRLLLWWD